jgi:hypothetical protein
MKTIVEKYGIGEMIDNHDPQHLAHKFDSMLRKGKNSPLFAENLQRAASELCWENEEPELINIYSPYV